MSTIISVPIQPGFWDKVRCRMTFGFWPDQHPVMKTAQQSTVATRLYVLRFIVECAKKGYHSLPVQAMRKYVIAEQNRLKKTERTLADAEQIARRCGFLTD